MGEEQPFLQCAPAQRADRPYGPRPHAARSYLCTTSVPPDVSRSANRAGRRGCDAVKRQIEHRNPNGFMGSICTRPRLLGILAAPARPWTGRFPGRNKMRRCRALNANDGRTTALTEVPRWTTLYTAPFHPPPPSIGAESRKKCRARRAEAPYPAADSAYPGAGFRVVRGLCSTQYTSPRFQPASCPQRGGMRGIAGAKRTRRA